MQNLRPLVRVPQPSCINYGIYWLSRVHRQSGSHGLHRQRTHLRGHASRGLVGQNWPTTILERHEEFIVKSADEQPDIT